MKTVASLTLLSLLLTGASLANAVSLADCAAQRTSLENQVNEAKSTNSLLKIAGLEKALIELNISCEKAEAAMKESQGKIGEIGDKIEDKTDQSKAAIGAGVAGAAVAGAAGLHSAKPDIDLSGLSDPKKEGLMSEFGQKKDELVNQFGQKKDEILGDLSQKSDSFVDQAKLKKDELVTQFGEKKDFIMSELDQKTDEVLGKVEQKKDELVNQFSQKKDAVVDSTTRATEAATTQTKEGIIDPLKQKVDGMTNDVEDKTDEIVSNAGEKRDALKPIDQNINPAATEAEIQKAKKDFGIAKKAVANILKIDY